MTTQTTATPKTQKQGICAGSVWSAFKNFAIIFSFAVNFVLVLVLLLSPGPLFMAKNQVAEPLLVDLDSAFAALGDTVITSTIGITDTMAVVFDLQLAQNTNVILTKPVPIQAPASFIWPAGGGAIHGTVQLVLPEGLALPVALNLIVPVNTTVPVVMSVPVEIPLAKAGMEDAINQLRAVFRPMTGILQSLPDTPQELFKQQP